MKKIIFFLATFLLLSVLTSKVKAQSGSNAQPSYKDMIGENTNAEADMKVVSDFVNALTSGDLVKAKSLLADNYKGHAPGNQDVDQQRQISCKIKVRHDCASTQKLSSKCR